MELEPRTAAPAHATGAVEFVPLSALALDATFRLREEGDVSALAASIGRLGQLVPVELRPLPGAGTDGPRFQVVAGFRRIAALRMLVRGRVLARVHAALDDDDAWGLALGQALLTEPLDRDDLRRLRERLEQTAVAPWAEELLDDALVRAPVEPELRERFFEFLTLGPPAADGTGAVQPGDDDGGLEPEAAPHPADRAEPGAGGGEGGAGGGEAGQGGEGGPPGAEGAEEVTPEELVADVAARLYQVNADLAVAFESWPELPADGRRAVLEQVRWMSELLPHLERREDER